MTSSIPLAARFAVLLVGVAATAGCGASATTEPIAATTPAGYPLQTCVVSGAKLGSMGPPVAHVYQPTGQPGRTVIFCCQACLRKLEREPAKYLARLDAAAASAGAR